ncbi:MAG: GNAT family N-acetyltransferase [Pseudomonadota bacterium]|jgi:GNAT superfamily N-acetyltransferase
MMDFPHEGRSEKELNTHRHQVRELTTDQDWREAWPVVNAMRPYVLLEPFLAMREEHIADGTRLFGLIKDQAVVSVAAIRISLHLSGERELYVKDLVTLEQYRSQGLGAELMSFLERLAISYNCFRLMLHSAQHREDAHRFYNKAGYHQHATVFIKELKRLY